MVGMSEGNGSPVIASVTSAWALSESQAAALRALIADKIHKPVEVALTLDPAILGGLRIQVDGYLIDRSIHKQLQDLRADLLTDYA